MEEEGLLLTLNYSFKKTETHMNTHCAVLKDIFKKDSYYAYIYIVYIKMDARHLPGFCGLVRCVCGGDGSYLLSISQQRSIGRFCKETIKVQIN